MARFAFTSVTFTTHTAMATGSGIHHQDLVSPETYAGSLSGTTVDALPDSDLNQPTDDARCIRILAE